VTSVAGLLSEAGREHGWPPAEDAGSEHPRPIRRALDRSVWDVAAVRADRRARAHGGGRQPGPTAGRPRRGRDPLLDRLASPDDPGAARPRCSGPRRGKRGAQPPTPRTTPGSPAASRSSSASWTASAPTLRIRPASSSPGRADDATTRRSPVPVTSSGVASGRLTNGHWKI